MGYFPSSLLVSFWDIALANFTEGSFRHRKLPNADAIELINTVSEHGTVFFGTDHDLAAPYKKRELEKTTELVRTLSDHWKVNIQIEDFFTKADDGTGIAMPITMFDIRADRPLIVVACNYVSDRPPRKGDLGMSIDL